VGRHAEADARRAAARARVLGGANAVPEPRLPKQSKLRPETRAWWRAWVERGEAAGFWATDWLTLLMLVPLVDAYNRDPRPTLSGEIRRGERRLERGLPK
jgi:hypothetical protein